MNVSELLGANSIVPLVQADDPSVAVRTSRALALGGLKVAEVVFRTDRALECLQAVADDVSVYPGTMTCWQLADSSRCNQGRRLRQIHITG